VRFRHWFRPPRRLRVLRPGGFVIAGTLGLGFAALNTGNNLLYLLLGALLGMIALSGWMSEHALRGVRIRRAVAAGVSAGEPARITYALERRRAWLPSFGLELREIVVRAGERAPVANIPAYVRMLDDTAVLRVRGVVSAHARGVYELEGLTVSTTFPFGLFRKERDVLLPGTLRVWPRTDRVVRVPAASGRRGRRTVESVHAASAAARGDYRGLRPYRPGDDRRDIHWRSSARRGELIVREYEQDAADEYWIVLDTVAPDEESGEVAVEIAAALVARAARSGERCGLAAGDARVPPGAGAGRTEALLDVLAGVTLSTSGAPPTMPPGAPCVLVTARTTSAPSCSDVYHAAEIVP
jgi:uncharacterized protein (DUF58 family)